MPSGVGSGRTGFHCTAGTEAIQAAKWHMTPEQGHVLERTPVYHLCSPYTHLSREACIWGRLASERSEGRAPAAAGPAGGPAGELPAWAASRAAGERTRGPDGELVHDDHIMADALVAKLDELDWQVRSPTLIIQAKDPLDEMSRIR